MASHRRLERLNQLLREELSRLVRRELDDPRVKMVTITDVDVSGDLRHATVFVRTLRDLEPDGPAAAGREGGSADA
ncbi:MAG: 30S ribosome-binding factor RbfA, partial [Gemmatimonadota bacterium]